MSPLRCARTGLPLTNVDPSMSEFRPTVCQGGSVLEVHDLQLAKNILADAHLFGMHGALREHLSPSGFLMINHDNVSVSRT